MQRRRFEQRRRLRPRPKSGTTTAFQFRFQFVPPPSHFANNLCVRWRNGQSVMEASSAIYCTENADDRATNYRPNSSSSFPTATARRCLLTKVFSKCSRLLLHISGRGNSQESSQDLLPFSSQLFFCMSARILACHRREGRGGRLSATKATGEGPRLRFSTPQTHEEEEEEAGRANTMNSPLSPHFLEEWRRKLLTNKPREERTQTSPSHRCTMYLVLQSHR